MLFGKQRDELFPDPFVRLIRFDGTTKTTAIDHADIKSAFPLAIDEILAFIRRNTSMRAVSALRVGKISLSIHLRLYASL
jgi:predicted HTH transcriptional regulator